VSSTRNTPIRKAERSPIRDWRNMNILLTGGAGFIGSHVLESLLHDGASVTVLDNFDPFYSRASKESNIAKVRTHPGLRFVEADIRDPAALHGIAGAYDAIVHLAAKAGVRPSIADPVAYQQTNIGGTLNLLEFARTWHIRQFIFASSSSVYGTNPHTPWSEDDNVLLPISPYASTKVSAELLGHVYSHLHGIRFIALRFFTVYGPRQRPDLAIRKFSEAVIAGRPIPIFGDGSTRRDYTYIDDIVAGIRNAIAYRASQYEVINLGNSQPVSLNEMVRTIEAEVAKQAILDYCAEQPGDVPQTYADVRKASRLLGWHPHTSFQSGISQFISWLMTLTANRLVPSPSAGASAPSGLPGTI
jgi:UDP-glucuronate 4-epimerase